MKKVICLFLFTLLLLCGCGNTADDVSAPSYVPDTLESYDNESVFIPSTESSEEAVSNENVSNNEETPVVGFLVKDKKYTHEGKDLVILSVENQTKVNYSLTITGSYLDKDGTVLKTEVQTFEGFAAGFLNYFLFSPEIVFDRFAYTVETEVYDGVCLIDYYEVRSAELKETKMIAVEEKGDPKNYPSIVVSYQEYNKYEQNLEVVRYVIVIDSNDQVYYIKLRHSEIFPKDDNQGWCVQKLCYEKADTIVWPKELQGDVKILFAYTDIKVKE